MLSPVRFAAIVLLVPALLSAQSQAAPSMAVRSPSGAVKQSAWSNARRAAICDGSEIKRFESKRHLGTALMIGSFAVDVIAIAQVASSHGDFDQAKGSSALIGASFVPGLVGAFLYWRSYPNESFWQRTLAGMRTGETRIEDVRECLRDPSAMSTAGSEEKLTYFTSRPITLE